ncbi:hypothetical protein [Hyperthermus butylicus]|uniref:Uncharacterized protein n=1 Tax=Hyperthermus butylicus (strain DSM 5456 / JCM 9403 / PLM1-5) TaxID=415426 RepID=A2BKR7_HYPBU|nr:hypothetical protein [Hyperthermus butylicus]ABM80578.1 hypothetical protein Hbut_0724 [Hyperthermus butylicus DSM 5456]
MGGPACFEGSLEELARMYGLELPSSVRGRVTVEGDCGLMNRLGREIAMVFRAFRSPLSMLNPMNLFRLMSALQEYRRLLKSCCYEEKGRETIVHAVLGDERHVLRVRALLDAGSPLELTALPSLSSLCTRCSSV